MHVRVCVDCGEEYRPEIATCADCGGQLEDRYGDADGSSTGTAASGGADEAEGRPEADFTVSVLRAEKATELTRDADRLLEAGIPFRVRSAATRGGYVILVTPEDGDRALSLLGLLADRSGEAGDAARTCPACETPVQAGAAECPECGLTVGDEDEEE